MMAKHITPMNLSVSAGGGAISAQSLISSPTSWLPGTIKNILVFLVFHFSFCLGISYTNCLDLSKMLRIEVTFINNSGHYLEPD